MKSVFVALLLVMLSSSLLAQDFSQLLASIDKLETTIKGMVTSEQNKREEAVKKLQADLDALKKQIQSSPAQPGQTGAAPGDVTAWKTETDKLAAENASLSQMLTQQADKLSQLQARLDQGPQNGEGQNQPLSQPGPDYNAQLANLSTQLVELKTEINQRRGYQSHDIAVPGEVSVNLPGRQTWNGLELSGYVNGSNYSDLTEGKSAFRLDNVALNVERNFRDQAMVQADLRYIDNGTGDFQFDLAQGFLAYKFGKSSWSATFGKFNTPMGYELPDAPDMYSYSHSLVYTYGQPVNVTGFQLAGAHYPFDWRAYLVNGWEVNADNNSGKTIGGRIGITPWEGWNVGLSAISGPERVNNSSSRRTALDCDVTVSALRNWLFGAEFNQGYENKTLPDNRVGRWNGFLFMSKYDFTEKVGLAGRFDYFDDNDGLRTGTAQNRLAFAIAPSLSIIDGLNGLVEFRWDKSDHKVFSGTNGSLKDSKFTGALEFTYGF